MRFYAPSQMKSVKDVAGFTQMKYRQDGQNSIEELKQKDLRSKLEEKERKHFLKASKEDFLGKTLRYCSEAYTEPTRVEPLLAYTQTGSSFYYNHPAIPNLIFFLLTSFSSYYFTLQLGKKKISGY